MIKLQFQPKPNEVQKVQYKDNPFAVEEQLNCLSLFLSSTVIPECRARVPNEWFVNERCTGRCRCRLSGMVCVSLCGQMRVKCSSDAQVETYDQPMDDVDRCTCKRERCVKKVGVW